MRRRPSPLAQFWTTPVSVQTYLGQGTDGADSFAPAVTVTGWLEAASKWVRGTDGVEVVSSSTFYAPIESADTFTPGTRVTPTGATKPLLVISVGRLDGAGLALPEHAVIALT